MALKLQKPHQHPSPSRQHERNNLRTKRYAHLCVNLQICSYEYILRTLHYIALHHINTFVRTLHTDSLAGCRPNGLSVAAQMVYRFSGQHMVEFCKLRRITLELKTQEHDQEKECERLRFCSLNRKRVSVELTKGRKTRPQMRTPSPKPQLFCTESGGSCWEHNIPQE